MKTLLSIVGAAAIATCAAQAQTESKEPARVHHDVITQVQGKEGIMFERRAFVTGPDTVEFVSAEATITGKTVKGAPYSAEAISESTQMLADGNRITSKSSATLYRDSDGRTRRDAALSVPGMSDPPTFITINDPIAGTAYHMDTKDKIARKLPVAPEGMPIGIASAPAVRVLAGSPGAHGEPVPGGAMVSFARTRAPQMAIGLRSAGEPKTEPLGKRVIEGVEAEGTRLTLIIPAGEVGNEREIHVVTERWYSPELQTVVLSKHSDPRFGETTYTLTQVKRSEPSASLFQIPSDYKVANEDHMPNVRFMRKLERK